MSAKTEAGRTRRSRRLIVIGVVLVAIGLASLSLSTGLVLGDGESNDPFTVDADHELADDEAIAEYEADGHTSGEVDAISATISYADSKDDVDRDGVRPIDAGHEYIRIEYDEDISRTLRIWIPEEYTTPYTRESVSTLESEHTAEYQPVRGGDYLQVTLEVDGPTDAVLPIHKHSAMTYSVISSYQERVDSITGGDREWSYVDRDRLADEHSVEITADPDDVVIHHDATPSEPEESWTTVYRDADGSDDGVYWYSPDSEPETVYIVTQGEETDVRYMEEGGGLRERAEGYINDARQIPDRITDRFDDGLGGLI